VESIHAAFMSASRRTDYHAVPFRQSQIFVADEPIADITITLSLLTLLQFLEEAEITRHFL
jgi:hypothetical protein